MGAREPGELPLLGESYPSTLRDHQRRIRFRGRTQDPVYAHPPTRSRRGRARRAHHRPVPTGSVVPQVHRPPVSVRPDRLFAARWPRLPYAGRRAERSRPPNQCLHRVRLLRAHDRSRVRQHTGEHRRPDRTLTTRRVGVITTRAALKAARYKARCGLREARAVGDLAAALQWANRLRELDRQFFGDDLDAYALALKRSRQDSAANARLRKADEYYGRGRGLVKRRVPRLGAVFGPCQQL